MANAKISALTAAASAQQSQTHVVVSGSTNKKITHAQMFRGVAMYQEATCRATATVADLPTGATIFDIYAKVLVGSSAAAGGTQIIIGRNAQANRYAEMVVSGNSVYRPNDSLDGAPPAGAWNNLPSLQTTSGAVIAAAPTASAAASFIVGIGYFVP